MKTLLSMAPPRVGMIDTRCARPMDKVVDAELLSPEHRAWRAEVMRRAGGRCERIENGRRCNRADTRMFANHKIERKDGGAKLDPANGECLCGRHHTLFTNEQRAKRMGANLPG
jgi:5-methylcytosine-specific restriction enzyme A